MSVVVFGESGSGKSSIVNLLLGRQAATVSDRAVGCTFDFQKYETRNYDLYDTVGLSEGQQGTVSQSFAVNQLINLLKSLENGVSLLVFVMEKGRIKKSLDENYKLFVEAICMHNVPVVLVITHCEMEGVPGNWWKENKAHFDEYGMKFEAVVCGCAMNPEMAPPAMQTVIKSLNESTTAQLGKATRDYVLDCGWKVKGGWRDWFQTVIKAVVKVLCASFGVSASSFLKKWFGDDGPSLKERLNAYFLKQGYDSLVARQLAKDIANAI